MSTLQLEKELLKYTKGLSNEALQEVIDFTLFIRQKKKALVDNIKAELSSLNYSQTVHLELEFQDYKQLYPSE